MIKPGERIGAVLLAKDNVCNLLGFGVYAGDHVPPKDVDEIGNELEVPSPRLDLDDGSVVWGFQCWWARERSVKHYLVKYDKVLLVGLDGKEKP